MSPPPDRAALYQQWLAEHGGIVVKVARSFAATPADAADLRQELLVQLWAALPDFAGRAQASTFIYRVCLNTALTWRRGTTRRERRIEPGADVGQLAAEAASPAEQADSRDLLEVLYAAIHGLADSDRALVLLSLDDLSYREIADITGLTENHVGVALNRARRRLADRLKGVTHELERL